MFMISGKYIIAPLLGRWGNPAQVKKIQSFVGHEVALCVA
jgi:hypothetical protein